VVGNRVNKIIYKKNNKKFKVKVDTLISTIPIKKLISLLNPSPPQPVIEASLALNYKSLILLYIIIDKPRLFNDNWIFFPEGEFIFNRISEQKGFSESMIPKDKTVLTIEITCDGELYKASKENILKRSLKDLERAGILTESDILDYFMIKLKNLYPVYDLNFRKNMNIILNYLNSIEDLYTNGRQGLFNYNNMDHCIDMGISLAEHIKNNGTKQEWEQKIKKFDNYRFID